MKTTSRPVTSNQVHVHPRLPDIVQRHIATEYRKSPSAHNLAAFDSLQQRIEQDSRPLILDSFCGTGRSTAILAQRHPEHLVVGIDKSADRLSRHIDSGRSNYLLLRADCEAIWQLLAEKGYRVDYHYMLYPNPWPKAKHLQRRVHGHPALARLLQLGGIVEVRSNWQLYLEEFGLAMHLAGHPGVVTRLMNPAPAEADGDLTLFERKYRRSGQALWVYRGAIR